MNKLKQLKSLNTIKFSITKIFFIELKENLFSDKNTRMNNLYVFLNHIQVLYYNEPDSILQRKRNITITKNALNAYTSSKVQIMQGWLVEHMKIKIT